MPKKRKQFSDDQQTFPFEFQQNLLPLYLTRPLVFFDLETTGLDLQMDRIVQFAMIRITPDYEQEEWEELVNPGQPIPPEATRVHGISDEMVRDKPPFSFFAERIIHFIGSSDLAGFNIIRFDLPLLIVELERCGFKLEMRDRHVVDMQTIFHKYEPRDLSAAYRFYCHKQLIGAHHALADVKASVEILQGQLERYADLPRNIPALAEFISRSEDDQWVTPDRRFYWRHNQAIMAFGKHRGKSLEWVHKNDADYLLWLKDQDFSDETRKLIMNALQGEYPKRKDKSKE